MQSTGFESSDIGVVVIVFGVVEGQHPALEARQSSFGMQEL